MRKYFITGLLILVPLAITFWVLQSGISTMDQSLLLLPEQWRPEPVRYDIPGLGLTDSADRVCDRLADQ
jgi:uncharacterized membrane protein